MLALAAHILKSERYSYCQILAIFPMLYNTPWSLFTSDSLYLPFSHPILLPPSRNGNQEFVLYICGSASSLLYSLVCCIFYFFIYFFFLNFKFYFIFRLYITVLVLPNIKMNPPQVYMCSRFHT